MRTLLLLLLFIAVPLAGGSLKPEMEIEFWKNSGAGADFAKSVINDTDCSVSEQSFHACRKALLVGAQLQGLDQHPDFKKIKSMEYSAGFPFEKTVAQILTTKTVTPVEWIVGKMVNALLRVLDPYAQLSPQAYSEYLLNGENKTFYGTGIEGEASGAGLFIYRIFPNSPADAKAVDLRVHDRIVSLNGRRLDTLSAAQSAVPQLNGSPGEKLTMEIERAGQRIRKVVIQVAPVAIPENPTAEFSLDGKRYLQVRLRSFSIGTCQYLEKRVAAAQAISEEPLAGLILDLRLNRGGVVAESECLVRLFLPLKNVVVREPLQLGFPPALDFHADPPPVTFKSGARVPFRDLPLTVLVNAKTASASEIAAGALQDFSRAWIVGERTYGKGVTQMLHLIKNFPKLTVTKTVSRYVRPSGFGVHGLGVMPNFEVSSRTDTGARGRQFMREEDAQLTFKFPQDEVWQEFRPKLVNEKNSCLHKPGVRAKAEAAVESRLGFTDHQAATALAILNCP